MGLFGALTKISIKYQIKLFTVRGRKYLVVQQPRQPVLLTEPLVSRSDGLSATVLYGLRKQPNQSLVQPVEPQTNLLCTQRTHVRHPKPPIRYLSFAVREVCFERIRHRRPLPSAPGAVLVALEVRPVEACNRKATPLRRLKFNHALDNIVEIH